jgi:hypothetical protein
VEQLHEEARPVGLNCVAHAPVRLDHLWEEARELVGGEDSRRVWCRRLEHDQPRAAERPRLVVGDEVVRGQVVVDKRRLVRRRDDPVLKLDRS